jgi:glycosyltransferase involved in cell wall biosynthesis
MYAYERHGDRPDEFPLRFLPFMHGEKIFDYADSARGVDVVASISAEQIDALVEVFPEFPRDRVVLSPNGYNQHVFRRLTEPTDLNANRANVLAGFMTQPPEGSGRKPEPVVPPDGFDAVVVFCGKFADWKRLDALLRGAAIYEQHERRILTLVVGSGPIEAQVQMQDLAADVGCFPSYREPFGLVFIECMACGTPVIGADSGGPRDFVTPEVGVLVPETDNRQELAASLATAVIRAVDEDWKGSKGPTAEAYAKANFSVVSQVSKLLAAVDRLTWDDPSSTAASAGIR